MMGPSHALSGAVAGLGVCAAVHLLGGGVHLDQGVVIVAGVAVGSLVPDLDHPRALASRSVPILGPGVSWLLRRASRAAYLATRTRFDDDAEGTHRYLTHTALFAVMVGAVASLLASAAGWWWWLGMPLAAGCLVHLAGDGITKMGVPVLWPLKVHGKRWWRFRAPLTFRTGSGWEAAVVVLLGLAGLGEAWVLVMV